MFSVCRKPGGNKKDTWANIEATGEFVVCMMSEWFVNAANHTCGNFAPEEDEFDLSGLTRVPSLKVKPPRVGESAFAMECKLRHHYDVTNAAGQVTATAVVGEVVLFHVHEEVADLEWPGKPKIDMRRYQPVSRLGGNTYGRTQTGYDMSRPDRPQGGR
jgi:flavin reductase (DIM6/NTAB) family NADH-FMN oxidoreductase RutF